MVDKTTMKGEKKVKNFKKKIQQLLVFALVIICVITIVPPLESQAAKVKPYITLENNVINVKYGEVVNINFTLSSGSYSDYGYKVMVFKGTKTNISGAVVSQEELFSGTSNTDRNVQVKFDTSKWVPGTYTGLIYPKYGSTGTKVYDELEFTITVNGDTETEDAISEEQAVNVKFDKDYTRAWGTLDDKKLCYNKINVKEPGIVNIQIDKPELVKSSGTSEVSVAYALYEEGNSDSPIYKGSGSNSNLINVGLKPGVYYLSLTPYTAVTGGLLKVTYNVSFEATKYAEKESNNSAETATELELGKLYKATYPDGDSGLSDNFKFNAIKGHDYKIFVSNHTELTDLGGCDAIITIYPSDESDGISFNPAIKEAENSGIADNYMILENVETTGSYRICVHNGRMNPISYSIGVYDITESGTTGGNASGESTTGGSASGENATGGNTSGIRVDYHTHIQTLGDSQGTKSNGEMAGTSGMAKRLENIWIKVEGNDNLGIQYSTHCQKYGWMPWSCDGESNGTSGEAKRLEAIKIQLTGADKGKYDVYYRVHAQSYGWLGWAKNGEPSGTAGYGKRLEGIQVVVVKKGEAAPGLNFKGVDGSSSKYSKQAYVAKTNGTITIPGNADAPNVMYKTHVQTYGWQKWMINGQMSGTSGESKRLEGINIQLTNAPYDGDIVYTTHVQTYGWQGKPDDESRAGWKKNGEMSGTSGEAKRLEAICVDLTGEMAEKYDIYYRVHAQTFGWLGWAKNGQASGTAGYAKRLEGIQIVLVPKGEAAPEDDFGGITARDARPFIEKK